MVIISEIITHFMDIILSTRETARLLETSEALVTHYRKIGRLTSIVVMGRPAYFKSQVEQIKAARGTGFKPGRPRKGTKDERH
jgi:hypothetical protein